MSSAEEASHLLKSVKAKSTTATETVYLGITFTGHVLSDVLDAIEALGEFSATLPSEKTLDTLMGSMAKARDETLDAHSILRSENEQTSNANLECAVERSQRALEFLATAHAARLQTGISQLHAHIAELTTLANETGSMCIDLGDTAEEAIAEGNGVVAEISLYQRESGVGE